MVKKYIPRFKDEDVIHNWKITRVIGRFPCSTDHIMRWKYEVTCTNCNALSTKWQFQLLRKSNYCIKCVPTSRKKEKKLDPFKAVEQGSIPDFISMGVRK